QALRGADPRRGQALLRRRSRCDVRGTDARAGRGRGRRGDARIRRAAADHRHAGRAKARCIARSRRVGRQRLHRGARRAQLQRGARRRADQGAPSHPNVSAMRVSAGGQRRRRVLGRPPALADRHFVDAGSAHGAKVSRGLPRCRRWLRARDLARRGRRLWLQMRRAPRGSRSRLACAQAPLPGAKAAGLPRASDRQRTRLLKLDTSEVEVTHGRVRGPGGRSVTLREAARAWYLRPLRLPPDVDTGGLEVTTGYRAERDSGTFSYAAHAAVVGVDRDTGAVSILDYVVVEDGGVLVNPMIVDG